jgi:glycosyltransferase involved in cell wall biosynthesis
MNVTVVTNIPSPYRVALYDEVNSRLEHDGGRLTVVYGSLWRGDRQWSAQQSSLGQARTLVVPGAQLRIRGRFTYASPRVVGALRASRPDVVVLGGYAPWMFFAAAWCRATRTPFILWSGETRASARVTRPSAARRVPFIRLAARAFAYGPEAADYLIDIGVQSERLTVLGNGIDAVAFAAQVDASRPHRSALRERLGLTGPTILSVGGKGLVHVVRALHLLPDDVQVAVVGKDEIDEVHPNVLNLGRRPSHEMPDLYAASDCVVQLKQPDQWPHAVNEALSAGIPVVAATLSGAPSELFTGPGCAELATFEPHAVADALAAALNVGANADASVRAHIARPLQSWSVPAMASRFADGALEALRSSNGQAVVAC